MITSFQFARLLRAELRDGSLAIAVNPDMTRAEAPLYYRVTGRLDTGPLFAAVEIHVWQDFSILKTVPPAVWCRETWMRDDPDWHNSHVGGMCWILEEVWRDGLNWPGKSALSILNEGRTWLVNDVRCLINRHYVAYREELTDWPADWPFWQHYNEGAREYERAERIRRQRLKESLSLKSVKTVP
jgi:hypothetical protein